MTFDLLIVGGGAAGMSCALVLGSAHKRDYVNDKAIGIIMHQKSSHLQNALFNNVLGITPGTTGASILESGRQQLSDLYPHIEQIEKERVLEIKALDSGYEILTNKNTYRSKMLVLAVGYTNLINIKGLDDYLIAHPRAKAGKERIALKNEDHKVAEGFYVVGTLAGWRSQFAMASGSGAHVATDILTFWNGGEHTKVHDKVEP